MRPPACLPCSVCRRETGTAVRYRVGQLLRHRRYQYRGVIVGWDPCCRADEEWISQMGVDRLPRACRVPRARFARQADALSPGSPCPACAAAGGRGQPFYRVLPDPHDTPGPASETYVAQENVQPEALPALHRDDSGGCCRTCQRRCCWLATQGGSAATAACSAAWTLGLGLTLPALRRHAGFALHPEVGRYFVALKPGGARYTMNAWMRFRFPDD